MKNIFVFMNFYNIANFDFAGCGILLKLCECVQLWLSSTFAVLNFGCLLSLSQNAHQHLCV
jgi:hypothetical protein